MHSTGFRTAVGGYDKSKTYLVYCGSVTNGGKAAADMRSIEFDEVYNLAGGYGAWTNLGGCPNP